MRARSAGIAPGSAGGAPDDMFARGSTRVAVMVISQLLTVRLAA